MKNISIIIPVYNEERFIDGLLKSIEEVEYPKDQYEVVVVSDGCTDRTIELVKSHPAVRLIELPNNMGRYISRKTGAEAARFSNLLFIDARAVVDPNILSVLNKTDERFINGYVMGVNSPGNFETFYNAIRRIIFPQYFKKYNQPVYLTLENFDAMPKGTGALYVEKDLLFLAYEELSQIEMGKDSSDDTKLLKTIVNHVPLLLHPDVKIINYARTSFRASAKHLYERGPKFVDYYFNPAEKKFWLVILLPIVVIAAILVGVILLPLSLFMKILGLIGLDFVVTLFLARSLREFVIILYMLPLCFLLFYSGIIRGIFIKSRKALGK